MKHVPYRPVKVPYKEPTLVTEGARNTGSLCIRLGHWEALGDGSLIYWAGSYKTMEAGLEDGDVANLPALTLLQTLSLLYKLQNFTAEKSDRQDVKQIINQFCGGIK